MLKAFYPDKVEKSVYDIDFVKLYEAGKRAILFDIDNTLVEHGADSNEKMDSFFVKLHEIGFKTCLMSNNNEERVVRFNKNIGTQYIFKAGKPSIKAYYKAMEKIEAKPEETIFIGDQLFTDIYGAKKAGLDNICVQPIGKKEKIQIVLKRRLEAIVFYSYKRHLKKKQ